MPTPDRTTIRAAIEELTNKLRVNLVANPPTSMKPFRRVGVGPRGTDELPRPFLSLSLIKSKPIGVTENDKLFEVETRLWMVTDAKGADPHAEILDKVGAVEDYLDSIIDMGVLQGAEGFDDRVWTFDYPTAAAGSRVATASATQTFVVKVQRQYNRAPAA